MFQTKMKRPGHSQTEAEITAETERKKHRSETKTEIRKRATP